VRRQLHICADRAALPPAHARVGTGGCPAAGAAQQARVDLRAGQQPERQRQAGAASASASSPPSCPPPAVWVAGDWPRRTAKSPARGDPRGDPHLAFSQSAAAQLLRTDCCRCASWEVCALRLYFPSTQSDPECRTAFISLQSPFPPHPPRYRASPAPGRCRSLAARTAPP
jgi:hypothetical protein